MTTHREIASRRPTPHSVGFALVVASGLLLATASRLDIASSQGILGEARVVGSQALAGTGIAIALIALIALIRPRVATTLVAATVGALAAGFAAALVIAAPTDDIFDGLPAPDYRAGGMLAIAAFGTGLAGALAVALSAGAGTTGSPSWRRMAAPSMAVAIMSLLVPLLGVLAIGLARLAGRRDPAAGKPAQDLGRTAGAGLVLGAMTVAGWAAAAAFGIALGFTGNLS